MSDNILEDNIWHKATKICLLKENSYSFMHYVPLESSHKDVLFTLFSFLGKAVRPPGETLDSGRFLLIITPIFIININYLKV
jgi:hypothetical protein